MSAIKYTHRHGRCRKCNVVFRWSIKHRIRVADAWCPRCRCKLQQTATALLDTNKTPIVDVRATELPYLDVAPERVNILGDAVLGTTSVIGRFKDSAALLHWSWQCGVDGKDYRKVRDDAAGVGHYTHAMAEAGAYGNELPPKPPEMSNEDASRAHMAYAAFEQWRDQVKLEIVATELPLVSEMHHFGGTIDLLARVNGHMTVLDYKASNAVYPDYVVQLAAYRQLAREHGYGTDVGGLVRFGKLYGDFTFHHWPSGLLDTGWESFQHMLELYKLDKQLKAAVR